MRALLNSSEQAAHTRQEPHTGAGGLRRAMPLLMTVDDAAELLRTTKRAIYAMIERRQLPGVVRIGRRVLLRADDLLHWIDRKRAPLPKE